MFKKIALGNILLLLIITLVGCVQDQPSDSDVLYDIRSSITFEETEINSDITLPTIDEEGVTATWHSNKPQFLNENGQVTIPTYVQGNQQVTLLLTLQKGDTVITKAYDFTVVADEVPEVIELNTDETDALTMDFSYENSDFLPDGVGEVSLVRCVDGDTAIFEENGVSFSARFLGIDTPESTAKFEPWGKAASNFTCDKLTNADTIVLQADPNTGRLDSYGERYLSWVWYDGRLLNLELVELAYSKAKGSLETLYGQLIFDVNLRVQFSGRRVWGEEDPNYDYSLEGVQITIEELVTNSELYYGRKVAIQGIVSRTLGGAAFIQQGDFGVYVYNRSWAPDLSVGNEVLISGVTVTYYPDEDTGAVQVSNYQTRDPYSQVISRDNTVSPNLVTIPEITDDHIGSLLQVEDLTITTIYEGNDGAFTITAEDINGNKVDIRVAENAPTDITQDLFSVGDSITVTGPLSRYMSDYQIMLTNVEDIQFN
ncbi:MAG: immunoglobulin-like domain-containing protein [Candidatus Izemoplasma sp.]|nr:immunoglobulin-like domain-containing protein [Candidatus Izemoplasma sp.]